MSGQKNTTSGQLVAGHRNESNGRAALSLDSDSTTVNGHGLVSGFDGIEQLAREAEVPSELLALAQGMVLAMPAEGIFQQIALEALKPVIGELSEQERLKLHGPLLNSAFKRQKDLDQYLSECGSPDKGGPVFSPMSMGALLAMPPKEWLISEVLGAGDLGMLYGPPGSGKTFVVVDLIFSACLGRQWAWRFDTARPLNVAYCAGEGLSGLPARFKAAAEYYATDDLPNFTFFPTVPQLHKGTSTTFDTLENIERFVREWQQREAEGTAKKLDLLILDTLHSATVGAEENSASDMGRVLATMKEAQKALGCAVLLVHHTNKSGSAERGSSALRGAMDTMISLTQVGTKWAIYCEKLKDGAKWATQTFDLTAKAESVRVWWNDPIEPGQDTGKQSQDKEKILHVLTEQAGTRLTARAIEEATGIAKGKQIYNLLSGLTESGQCKREQQGRSWVYFVDQDSGESVSQ